MWRCQESIGAWHIAGHGGSAPPSGAGCARARPPPARRAADGGGERSFGTDADNGVGELLLNELRKDSSDMLVMGAFGHTRLREMVFGGATRYVFKNLHVPVLLSH